MSRAHDCSRECNGKHGQDPRRSVVGMIRQNGMSIADGSQVHDGPATVNQRALACIPHNLNIGTLPTIASDKLRNVGVTVSTRKVVDYRTLAMACQDVSSNGRGE